MKNFLKKNMVRKLKRAFIHMRVRNHESKPRQAYAFFIDEKKEEVKDDEERETMVEKLPK